MDLREELMQKLYEEQAAYKDHLCKLPAQEILDHATNSISAMIL